MVVDARGMFYLTMFSSLFFLQVEISSLTAESQSYQQQVSEALHTSRC